MLTASVADLIYLPCSDINKYRDLTPVPHFHYENNRKRVNLLGL